ncbi:hypothetical protein [Alkalihalobacillus sp. LMS39]|uniref:YncE family protein n=1 Tax=Alkalihalobacillus sp. LMS39 TaxID=2924032 RepID=UPI001FB2275B|nr:hypothetical protein [Alkalihalobacillus sp. LMS39]UOE95018.1 hypothetical protein MM271_05045 [Alkalihalobacillus sp. LMS39]
MKRCCLQAFLIGIILFLVGCHTANFETPDTNQSLVIVSHVKEETMTFLDPEQGKVQLAENSHFPITEMHDIGNERIVATSQSESSLLLYDIGKGKVTPFLKMNKGLTALEYDFLTNSLYVTDILNNQVHLIDMNNEKLVQSIEVATFPTDLEFGDEKLFVLSAEENSVTVTDLQLQSVLNTFPVLERPSGMYYDGKVIWVGGHGSFGQLNKKIYGYDPKTGDVVEEIEVGLMPIDFFGFGHDPYFYVLCHGNHHAYKVNKKTREVHASLEVGLNPNFITGNKETLFVSNLDGDTISIINKEAFERVEDVPVSAGPYAILLLEE